jgi:hypothetical protein
VEDGGGLWTVIGLVAVAGVLGFLIFGDSGSGGHADEHGVVKGSGVAAPERAAGHGEKAEPPKEAPPSEAPPKEAPPSEAPPSEAPPSEAPPSEAPPSEAPPSGGDPRAVPPGTPEPNARNFQKIPLAPADGPPLGAIAESGLYLDQLALGSQVEERLCAGKTDDFSAAADTVSLCLRAIHHREVEELVVLWQRDGKTVRRSKVAVSDAHAVATRTKLALRPEYVGEWEAIVVAGDVELAKRTFTVVE